MYQLSVPVAETLKWKSMTMSEFINIKQGDSSIIEASLLYNNIVVGSVSSIKGVDTRAMHPIYTMGDKEFGPVKNGYTGELVIRRLVQDQLPDMLPPLDIRVIVEYKDGKSIIELLEVEFIEEGCTANRGLIKKFIDEKQSVPYVCKHVKKWRPYSD